MKPAELRQEMAEELERILAFWMRHTVDRDNGGFYGRIDGGMTVRPEAPKGLVLNARILWTFARAYRHEPKPEYLSMADRAFAYLRDHFRDPEHPGYFWLLDSRGNPLVTEKQTYGQAFCLYGLSEYMLATGRSDLPALAREAFEVVERSFDPVRGGYREAYSRAWTEAADSRLGVEGRHVKKSMNTNLHVLEAYTNYYRASRSAEAGERLARLIADTIDRIVDPETGHFRLFFEEDWKATSGHVSYGHDIEGSWLLQEAAEALGRPDVTERAKRVAKRMAEAVLERGVDADGAVMWEGDKDRVLDHDKHWWGQAEAVVGFVNAWRLTGEERYWQAAARCWAFIRDEMLDRGHGEWHSRLDRNGVPQSEEPIVSEWKCPYHNSRSCFEIMERLA